MRNPLKLPLSVVRHLLPDPSSWDLFDLPPVELPEGRWLELPRRGRTWLTDVPGPTPDAPAIVLLHAVGCTGQLTWFPAIPRLAEHYRVITFDQRWHGRGITSERFLISDCATDVAAVIDELGLDRPDHRRLLDGLGHRAARVAPAPRRGRRTHPGRQHRPFPHQRPRARVPRRDGARHGSELDAVTIARGPPGEHGCRRGDRRRQLRHRRLGHAAMALEQPLGSRPGRGVPRPPPLDSWLSQRRRAHRRRRDHQGPGDSARSPARHRRADPRRHGARGCLRSCRLRAGAPGVRTGAARSSRRRHRTHAQTPTRLA